LANAISTRVADATDISIITRNRVVNELTFSRQIARIRGAQIAVIAKPLINRTIAIIVLPVAHFRTIGTYAVVSGITVVIIQCAVVVIIRVARIAESISICIELIRVIDLRAVIL